MEIQIRTEFIKLDSLLKLSQIAPSGGVAKMMIAEKMVLVNGELCTMRGKKIRNGDHVTVNLYNDDDEIENVIEISVKGE
jgi:ribosome-associated protein